jgi:hypothetical protein
VSRVFLDSFKLPGEAIALNLPFTEKNAAVLQAAV